MKALVMKFMSRRLVVLAVFGGVVPMVFHHNGINETVTMVAMGLAAAYLGQRAMRG